MIFFLPLRNKKKTSTSPVPKWTETEYKYVFEIHTVLLFRDHQTAHISSDRLPQYSSDLKSESTYLFAMKVQSKISTKNPIPTHFLLSRKPREFPIFFPKKNLISHFTFSIHRYQKGQKWHSTTFKRPQQSRDNNPWTVSASITSLFSRDQFFSLITSFSISYPSSFPTHFCDTKVHFQNLIVNLLITCLSGVITCDS